MTKRQPESGKPEAGKPEAGKPEAGKPGDLKKNEEGKDGKEIAHKPVSKSGRTYDKNHHNAMYHQGKVGEYSTLTLTSAPAVADD